MRVTALLLGQLSAEEATALRLELQKNPELQQLHDRLQQTIGLVREVRESSDEADSAPAERLTLSAERRARLLASFKTIRPKELAQQQQRRVQRRELMLVAAMLAGLMGVASVMVTLNQPKARAHAQRSRPELLAIRPEQVVEEEFAMPASPNPAQPDSDEKPASGTTRNWFFGGGAVGKGITVEADNLRVSADRPVAANTPESKVILWDTTTGEAVGGRDSFALGVSAARTRVAGRGEAAGIDGTSANAGDAVVYSGIATGGSRGAMPATERFGNAGIGTKEPETMLALDVSGRADKSEILHKELAQIAAATTPTPAGPAPAQSSSFGTAVTELGRKTLDDVAFTEIAVEKKAPAEPSDTRGYRFHVAATPAPAALPPPPPPAELALQAAPSGRGRARVLSTAESREGVILEHAEQWAVTGLVTAGQDQKFSSALAPASKPAENQVLARDKNSLAEQNSPASTTFEHFDTAPQPTAKRESIAIADLGTVANQSLNFGVNESVAENNYFAYAVTPSTGLPLDPLSRGKLKTNSFFDSSNFISNAGSVDLGYLNGPGGAQAGTALAKAPSDDFDSETDFKRRTDASIPIAANGTVMIPSKPGTAPAMDQSLWGRVRGALMPENDATVRLAVPDHGNIQGIGAAANSAAFDPYFVQTEGEKLKSKAVLGEVVDQLKLNEAWGERTGIGLSAEDATSRLRAMIEVRREGKSGEVAVRVKGDNKAESAKIADAVAQKYQEQTKREEVRLKQMAVDTLTAVVKDSESPAQVAAINGRLSKLKQIDERKPVAQQPDPAPVRRPAPNAATPQPEVITAENAFSTFSLNVSDVSFKLAAASLEKNQMPDAASVRTEEFINAFDYRDPEPTGNRPLAFNWERARYPFAHNRDLLRFSVKTAASGRQAGRPLNLVLLLDNSGSMERADRIRIRQECLRVLATQLQPSDRVSVVAFARTPRLWVDGLPGSQAGELAGRVGQLTPDGGTNLEEAMNLAYQTARRYFQAAGINRVVLLTDGAANLGDVEPDSLRRQVEVNRQHGVALDCFGIGWDGYNDDLLEALSRNGDGRYGFINTPEAATTEFAGQLAGALRVAASDVKVQVQFNPRRVTAHRQMGYAKHQLTKEQFRDNTVDAAEIGAAEAGNALYVVEVNPAGEGPLGVARVRFKVPGTSDYREQEWTLAYDGAAKGFAQAAPSLRLAGVAAAFSEWLVASPFAAEVTPSGLQGYLTGVSTAFGNDTRPKQLETMLRQAGSLAGK